MYASLIKPCHFRGLFIRPAPSLYIISKIQEINRGKYIITFDSLQFLNYRAVSGLAISMRSPNQVS